MARSRPLRIVRLAVAVVALVGLSVVTAPRGAWVGVSQAAPRAHKPQHHTVVAGQTLGRIAKRYRLDIDTLCAANGLRRSSKIKPGQVLLIPPPEGVAGAAPAPAREPQAPVERKDVDTEGAPAAAGAPPAEAADADGPSHASAVPTAPAHLAARSPARPSPRGPVRAPREHRVAPGQTLGSIARRYRVSIEALCGANDLRRPSAIKPGLALVIPAPDDADGSATRAWREEHPAESPATARRAAPQEPRARPTKASGASWRSYRKAGWRRGYLTLETGEEQWKGHVIGPKGRIIPRAREAISKMLASWRTGKRVDIDPRLIDLIAQVSDTFGGRPIHVVSGYREISHSRNSRHKVGCALDFTIDGVPNSAVRDYLRTLPQVGVGYYPSSTFVHLDVRAESTYWIDHAGPGEAPRYARR